MDSASYQRLREVVAERVERNGAHLIDLVVRGEHGTRVVEVFIDSESGVTSELCTAVSRDVGTGIDAAEGIEGAYRLDVSSPGIDRPLTFPWQYRKHMGRTLQIKLQPGQSSAERAGTLVAVDETGIVLHTGGQGEEARIPFELLREANVKAPW